MASTRACVASLVLALIAGGCKFDLHSIPSVEECRAAGLTDCGSSGNGGNAGNAGGIGGNAGGSSGNGGNGGVVGGIGGFAGNVAGIGGIGGAGIGGIGGGIGGSGGIDARCGTTACPELAFNLFVQLETCCFDPATSTCGAREAEQSGCYDAFNPGTPDPSCPDELISSQLGTSPVSGCCRTDGRCGLNGSLAGVGCVAREEMPFSLGGPRDPISCGGGGDDTAPWLPTECRDCVESACVTELINCGPSCRDLSTCSYEQCGSLLDANGMFNDACVAACGRPDDTGLEQVESLESCRMDSCSTECAQPLDCSLQNNPQNVYLARNASVQCSGSSCWTEPAPLGNNVLAAVYWEPCGGLPFQWTADGSFESTFDWLCVGGLADARVGCACGSGTSLTGDGPWSGTAMGGIIVSVATDGSVSSEGMTNLYASCWSGPLPN